VAPDDKAARRTDEQLRLEAAAWFAKLRGPAATRHQAEFDIWRKADPRRQAVYDRLVRRWDDAAVLADAHVRPRLASSPRRRRRWPSARTPWRAAALAVGAMAAALILSPIRPAWIDNWPIPSLWSHRMATRIGEIRSVRLSDGSSVTLDTNTVVITRFSSSARRLELLRGRARFDVAHDPARDFIVAAGGGAVAARGTLFDVELLADQQVAVTLMRGLVDVEPGSASRGASGHRATRLLPGQQFAFGRMIAAPRIEPASPAESLWPAGLLTFSRTPLSQALSEANGYSRTRIRLADASLADLQVSGVFRPADPRALAQSMAAAFDLRVEHAPNGDLVLARP